MKLWLKNNLVSTSEECVDTEPLACTDLVRSDYFELFGSSNGTFLSRWSFKKALTYLMVKQKSLGR